MALLPQRATSTGMLVRPSVDDTPHWVHVPAVEAATVAPQRAAHDKAIAAVPGEVGNRLPDAWIYSRPRSRGGRRRDLAVQAGVSASATTALYAVGLPPAFVVGAGGAAIFAGMLLIKHTRPTTETGNVNVTLTGWYADQVTTLSRACRELEELAVDVPDELGRDEIEHSAELAMLAGAGLLADAQQVSDALQRYLDVSTEPDTDILDAAGARLASLQASWSTLTGELAGVLNAVIALGERTKESAARRELAKVLDRGAYSPTEADATFASAMLACVRDSSEASSRALAELKSYCPVL